MKSTQQLGPIALGSCLLALVSCAGDTGGGGSAQQQQQDDHGVYTATLTPVNSGITRKAVAGVATITIEADNVDVRVNMTGVAAGVAHRQEIRTGTRCPTTSDDTNHDGLVDVGEGLPAYGPILIPLDGSLTSQAGGAGSDPMGTGTGTYNYHETAVLSQMLSDLHAVDPDATDTTVKLQTGDNLNLAGKVIVVHGVSANNNLPATVATINGQTPAASLPIACGTITRISGGTTTSGTTTGTTGTTAGTTTGTTAGTTGGTTAGTTTGTTAGTTTGTTAGTTTGTTAGTTTGTTAGTTTGTTAGTTGGTTAGTTTF